METLIPIYKEAILDLDEKAVSDIEAMICNMEKEKNELIQKVASLSADIASKKDNYIHLQADFDNFRKRFEKDRLTFTSKTQLDLIESLLPLVDNFERAKQQNRPETEKEKNIATSYQGIYKQFVETMRSLRVAVIGTVGKPFDPSLHEAIAREESLEFKEGIIVQEIRRGFLLGDRILRPAKVKVSAGPGRYKATTTSEKSIGQPTATAGLDESSLPNR
ncbi:GrpE nucleotide exchange factor [Macleaya cordata]|uniref:GrpE protein homolog n=1 Tax=Macleaya cordata TaxID=56857 RepID=A0A200Q6V8_MACCD|nr:GrpE nucleotide exchange factor [Macleaya cordata]